MHLINGKSKSKRSEKKQTNSRINATSRFQMLQWLLLCVTVNSHCTGKFHGLNGCNNCKHCIQMGFFFFTVFYLISILQKYVYGLLSIRKWWYWKESCVVSYREKYFIQHFKYLCCYCNVAHFTLDFIYFFLKIDINAETRLLCSMS